MKSPEICGFLGFLLSEGKWLGHQWGHQTPDFVDGTTSRASSRAVTI
jgi:hypothetical protein